MVRNLIPARGRNRQIRSLTAPARYAILKYFHCGLIALWLTAGLASAAAPGTIFDTKMQAAGGAGVRCLLQGVVTLLADRGDFYLQDESSGVRVASEPYLLKLGQRLEVEGWMYLADSGEFRVRARQVWDVGEGVPRAARLIPLPAALDGGYQGELVSVRGVVLEVEFSKEFDSLSIQSGRSSLRVFYPVRHRGLSVFEKIYPGMQVAVTGVSVPQTVDPEFDGYQVRLRSPADLAVRQSGTFNLAGTRLPPLEWLASAALILLAGAILWTIYSRHRRARPASQVQ